MRIGFWTTFPLQIFSKNILFVQLHYKSNSHFVWDQQGMDGFQNTPILCDIYYNISHFLIDIYVLYSHVPINCTTNLVSRSALWIDLHSVCVWQTVLCTQVFALCSEWLWVNPFKPAVTNVLTSKVISLWGSVSFLISKGDKLIWI